MVLEPHIGSMGFWCEVYKKRAGCPQIRR